MAVRFNQVFGGAAQGGWLTVICFQVALLNAMFFLLNRVLKVICSFIIYKMHVSVLFKSIDSLFFSTHPCTCHSNCQQVCLRT